MERRQLLTNDEHLIQGLFDRHSISASLSLLGVQACLIINSALAGKFFEANGLAVMSVVSPLYSVFAAIGALVGIGGAILTAQHLGRDDRLSANQTFTCALKICFGLSVGISAVMLTFEADLLEILGCTAETCQWTEAYSTIYIAGGLGTALFYLPYHFLKLVGRLKVLIFLFSAMAVENFLLDVLFCAKFQFGMAGIALGTIISSAMTGIAGILILLHGEDSFRLVSGGNTTNALLRLGTPSALNNLLNFARFVVMNQLLLAIAGNFGLVIFSIIRVIENFANIILSGLAQASTAFVGVFFQEHDNTSIRLIEKRGHIIGLVFVAMVIAGIHIFHESICDSFGIMNLPERAALTTAIDIFALSLIPSVPCLMLSSYYQAAGFTRIANVIISCRGLVLFLVPAYFLPQIFGVSSIWFAFVVASVGTLLILAVTLLVNRNKYRSPVLLLDLKAEELGECISFSVKNTLEDIVSSVRKIESFCEQNQLSRKYTILIKLSMEEIMMLINNHCLISENQNIDLRVLILHDDRIFLRIRYGGKIFNPLAYYESKQTAAPLALDDALGISMILNAAESVNYKHTFGINNIAVVLNCAREVD